MTSPTYEGELRAIITAWEALPGDSNYTNEEIDEWLNEKMLPAIRRARTALGLPNEPSLED